MSTQTLKILVIDDEEPVARGMSKTLEGLGEISICTKNPKMPELSTVLELVRTADIILLDDNFGVGTGYNGMDIYPHCQGKKVIGISSIRSLDPKRDWPQRNKKTMFFMHKESLREWVKSVIDQP